MDGHDQCDPSRLIAVLGDSRDEEPDVRKTIEHLTQCSACQSRLEQLAADPWWWSEGRALLRSSAAIDVDSLPSGSQLIVQDQAGDSLAVCEPPPLDFLQPPSHPELLGRLGKYEIERIVGWGGMGVVFKGFDGELNRVVAIKVLAPHLASSGAARQRFAREARAAAAVVHEHVVAIHGIETGAEPPYLVMPYVAGESLERHVQQHGPLPAKDVVRIAMQIAAGLAAAHEQGLVHRDVKPANILLENGFGRVLITDFGLARAADDASLTRTGLLAGTPHYMSPEQANGQSVDHRSDLFSLGSVMYFMATGRPPFRAEGAMAVLNLICHKRPAPLLEVNSDVPPPLAMIIERLHERQSSHRWESAATLRGLLADYLAHLQNPARHKLPGALAKKSGRRGTRVALALACLSVALLVTWPVIHVRRQHTNSQTSPWQPETSTASAKLPPYDDPSPSHALDAGIESLAAEVSHFEQQTHEVSPSGSSAFWEHIWQEQIRAVERDMETLEESLRMAAEGRE
jgi:serine/threonine-protein kinase